MRNAILLAALIAAPASAQTTTCRTIGGITTCDTQQRNGVNWGKAGSGFDASQVTRAYEEGQRHRQEQDAAQQAELEYQQQMSVNQQREEMAIEQEALRQKRYDTAAQMIVGGNCSGAVTLAITESDLYLAKAIQAYCPKPH